HGAGEVIAGRTQDVVAPAVAGDSHRVTHHVEDLEGVPFRVAVLELNLDAIEVGPARFLVTLHGAVHLLVVRPAGALGELAGGEGKTPRGIPDIGGRGVVVGVPLRHARAVCADVP